MTAWFERWAGVSTAAITVATGIGDYVTGVEITFFVFTQVFVIGLAVWTRGRLFGGVLAVVATGFAALAFSQIHVFGFAAVANIVGVLGTLLCVVFTLGALRDHVARERRERRVAIEQLRHAERLNVIGCLAAGVAHELGTPLNVISGTAEMLETEEGSVILSQTDKINRIVRQLLDFGRRGGATRTVVDLDDLVGSAVSLLAATARKASVDIVLDRASAPIRIEANSAELEQVVTNLVLNGIQAMPRGGELRVATDVVGGKARITVEDRGIGIAPADLPRVFDPFFTTKGVGEGTGLGLSVSHGIVTDHGGSIDVASQLGHGTRFQVMLPAA